MSRREQTDVEQLEASGSIGFDESDISSESTASLGLSESIANYSASIAEVTDEHDQDAYEFIHVEKAIRFLNKKVYFLGVDLYTSSYFWTGDERYEKYNIPKTMYVEEGVKHNGKHFHSTHKTANFIKEFSEHNNIEVVNLSKDSLLKDFIPTITYDEFLKENI